MANKANKKTDMYFVLNQICSGETIEQTAFDVVGDTPLSTRAEAIERIKDQTEGGQYLDNGETETLFICKVVEVITVKKSIFNYDSSPITKSSGFVPQSFVRLSKVSKTNNVVDDEEGYY